MKRGLILILLAAAIGVGAAAVSFSQGERSREEPGPYFAFYVRQASAVKDIPGRPFGSVPEVQEALNAMHRDGYTFIALQAMDPDRILVICRKQ